MRKAINYLTQKHGKLDPPWGEVNRLVRGNTNLPLDGGPDLLRAISTLNLDDNETRYATNGDSWIAIVEWPQDQPQQAKVIHQFGSTTDKKNTQHYDDQASLFASQQWRSAHLDKIKLRENATKTYQIGKKNVVYP